MVEACGNGNNGGNGGSSGSWWQWWRGENEAAEVLSSMLWTRDKGNRLVESLQTVLLIHCRQKMVVFSKCVMRMTNDSNIQLTAQFRHHWLLPDISNKLSVENLLSNFQQFQILTATMATVLVSRGTLAFDFIKIELKLFPAFVVFKLYPPTA